MIRFLLKIIIAIWILSTLGYITFDFVVNIPGLK